MIDIHTHILPDVDDGSKDLETSIKLIEIEIEQGVTDIVLTPHVQSRVTRATKEEQIKRFEILKSEVFNKGLNINLHLAAEIHYRSHLDTNYDLYAFGKKNYVLLEFPTRIETPIEDICYDVMHLGYQVIVAHVERYQYLEISDIIKIKKTGAMIQVNASSILNLDKNVLKKTVRNLIKYKLIDVVATDTHNLEKRSPNLLEAKEVLKKHYQAKELDQLFNSIKL